MIILFSYYFLLRSVLTAHIAYNLLRLSMSSVFWNVLVYSNTNSTMLSAEPFSNWKIVIISVLADYYQFSLYGSSVQTSQALSSTLSTLSAALSKNGRDEEGNNGPWSSNKQDKRYFALQGLMALKEFLPVASQDKLSLLTAISSVFECNDAGCDITGPARLQSTVELLAIILRTVREQRKCVLLFHL
jgi:hypothetical protein